MKKMLKRRGYILLKSELTSKQLSKIRKDLNVKPYVNQQYGPPPTPFPIYLESPKKLYLPRHYGIENFGEPTIDILENGEEINVSFNKTLRPYQVPIVDAMMDAANKKGGGLICVPCGWGKTVIAINILSRLKRKTLVIVHKEFLMEQWKTRINDFLDNVSIGTIQGKKVDIINKDIVLGMLQSISMKDYPKYVFEQFGTVIFDECHHLGAEVFSKALPKVASKYMIGLSATPKRKDGLTKVFEWYIGNVVYSAKREKKECVDVRYIKYKLEECMDKEFYSKECINYAGRVNIPQMITNICSFSKRTEYIIDIIKDLIKAGRKCLLLSDRRDHLTYIKNALDTREICSSGYYVGGMKQKDLKISEEKQILLATYSMASEGFDVPSLNTLILASPKSSIEQSVGRILRQRPEDRLMTPLIIDIVDDFSVFARQAIKRKRFYKRNKYNVVYESNTQSFTQSNLQNYSFLDD